MKSHFVMLAESYNPEKHRVAGQYLSEKLDGFRCVWDGGITRGIPADQVPWANCAKHGRFRNQVVATGLWTRYCQPVQAPSWFLDKLPPIPLDGELWAGRGNFQRVSSTVRKLVPDTTDWMGIQYMIFDSPSIYQLFQDREIIEPNLNLCIDRAFDWAIQRRPGGGGMADLWPHPTWQFHEYLAILRELIVGGKLQGCDFLNLHTQQPLSANEDEARAEVEQAVRLITGWGGEGAIIRYRYSTWRPNRVYDLLKVKPEQDAEAQVIGYTFGRKTALGSKLLGLMGALIVQDDEGRVFELSGFTNSERQVQAADTGILSDAAINYAKAHPGEQAPDWIGNPNFPRGSRVTFKYRERTDAGIPKEARYFRPA